MRDQNMETMKKYLSQLAGGGDFQGIPMDAHVHFTGPLASADTADDYRSILESFAEGVQGVTVRSMVGDDDTIHVVYDVDMGLRTGPLLTSQTVGFRDGAFSSVQVIFDAAAIHGGAAEIAELTENYYRDFSTGGDFTSVPMASDLRFRGPIHAYVGGDRYRKDCVELAAMVQELTIHHQFFDGSTVHTVHDLDVGLPSGPIPSAETLEFVNGTLVSADLIIDSTPLRPVSGNA